MPTYSDGPFSRIVFMLDRDYNWETHTFKYNRFAPANSLVNILISFNAPLVNTQLLKARK